MPSPVPSRATDDAWTPTSDPDGRFSTGIPDFDRLSGGGFQRGSLALFNLDETVTQDDRDLLFTPTFLNFLYQSRGMIAVLPTRDSPHGFRARLTRFATRRRFDARVRIIDYVGEDSEEAYVVSLVPLSDRKKAMAKMEGAERAAMGVRRKPFLELNAFEVIELIVGGEAAGKMFFHGIKRARIVGNLVIGLLRPGLACADAVRGMADAEFQLSHDEVGLRLRGVRPGFPDHLVTVDPKRGAPHVAFVPRP